MQQNYYSEYRWSGTNQTSDGKQTPMRYTLKAIMAGFLLSIVTVFMLAIKTQFASTHNDGLINLMGAIAFSLGLVLVVLTNLNY